MSPNDKSNPSDDQILQFVQSIKMMLTKVTNSPTDDPMHLLRILQENQAREKIDPAEFHRMGNILYEQKNPTMGDLSQALSVPLSTATRMANWWVDSGFAQRLSDPGDRRVVRLSLTESGEKLLEALEGYITDTVKDILSCLTQEERIILITLCRKVASSFKAPAK